MSSSSPPPAPYFEKDVVNQTTKWALASGSAGLLTATIQNALGKHSHGAAGVITRYGGTISYFTVIGTSFALTESVVANYRQKDDAWNAASGAATAGFLAGLRARSLPVAIGSAAAFGATMAGFEYAGYLAGLSATSASNPERHSTFFKRPPIQYQPRQNTQES